MKKISNITSVFTLFPLLMLIALSGTAKPTIDEITPVLLGDLEQERGMGGVVDVTDNYNANSVTGNNSIDRGSFNDASGVFSIIQNTGNNVIIQESTIITVTIAPN